MKLLVILALLNLSLFVNAQNITFFGCIDQKPLSNAVIYHKESIVGITNLKGEMNKESLATCSPCHIRKNGQTIDSFYIDRIEQNYCIEGDMINLELPEIRIHQKAYPGHWAFYNQIIDYNLKRIEQLRDTFDFKFYRKEEFYSRPLQDTCISTITLDIRVILNNGQRTIYYANPEYQFLLKTKKELKDSILIQLEPIVTIDHFLNFDLSDPKREKIKEKRFDIQKKGHFPIDFYLSNKDSNDYIFLRKSRIDEDTNLVSLVLSGNNIEKNGKTPVYNRKQDDWLINYENEPNDHYLKSAISETYIIITWAGNSNWTKIEQSFFRTTKMENVEFQEYKDLKTAFDRGKLQIVD